MGRAPASLGRELAVRHRAVDFAGVMGYLPNPDPVLRGQGGGIRVYRDLMVDDRVRGSWTNRIGSTLALEWEIDRGAARSRRARAIEDMLGRLDISRIMGHILQCRLYGYQPMEIIWERRDGLILPRDVVAKPPEWFLFSPGGELRFRTRSSGPAGEELPPGSFICPVSEADYLNPYGIGLLASCFWPVAFKKGGWRFWVTFAEKYGQAFALGKIRRGAPVEEMRELADRLDQMVQDAVAVIYDDSSVELLEAGKGATSALFRDLIACADTAISTVILGHAGAGQSTSGRLGGDDLAGEVRQDIRDSDRRLVAATFNQLIAMICAYNWGDGETPRFCLWEEEDVDLAQAERDEKLSLALSASGLRLSRAYYEEAYNLRPEHLEEAPAPPAGGAAFAEAAAPPPLAARVPDLMADRMEAEAEPAWGEIMDAIRRMVEEADSLPALRDRLLNAFGDLPTDRLSEVMAMGFAAADLAGRYAVESESDGGRR